jgi:transposase
MRSASGAGEFRRAQCVYLRAVLGLSVKLTARVLGCSPTVVSRVHHRYLRRGEAALWGPGRGGARRSQPLSRRQVAEVLRALAGQRPEFGLLRLPAIHAAMEAKAGRPLDSTCVQSLLDRHGWSRAAVVTVPHQPSRNFTELTPEFNLPAAPDE